MNKKTELTVSVSPHTKSPLTVTGLMLDVIIALIPAAFSGVAVFGFRAALIMLTCVISCVSFEYGIRRLMKRTSSIGDLTAVITGLLLAFCLPVTIPLWMCIIGSFIAIVLVKQLFGGVGRNIMNPAITARLVLMVLFTSAMTDFSPPAGNIDAISTATPLAQLAAIDRSGDISAQISALVADKDLPGIFNMLFGVRAGSIGEISSVALLLGAVFLILRGVISITIPSSFLLTTGCIMLVASDFNMLFTVYQLAGGGLILGAFFMATDYSTSPISRNGKIIFGIGCGLITAIIRLFTPLADGVAVAIIIMNIASPFIEKALIPDYFGKAVTAKEAFISTVKAAFHKPARVTVEETVETVEETVEETPEEPIETVEAAEETPEEPAQIVEETTEETPEEPAQIVEEAAEETPEEPVETVEETAEETPEEPAEIVEEAAEETPVEPVEIVEEAAEETPVEPVEIVEETAKESPEEPVEIVEETAEETPEEPVETVEEAAEETPEEPAQISEKPAAAAPEAPKKPVRLIDELSPTPQMPSSSRSNGRFAKKKPALPANTAFDKKKNKHAQKRSTVNIDLDTPLPDVIPAFLKKDIEKNQKNRQQQD